MRKQIILFMATLLSVCAFAEKGTIILTSPLDVQLLAVSPNGKWACGISGDGITSTEKGVLWNIETGEITYLSTSGSSTAYDVADDGTVVGSGGYYRNGRWNRYDNSSIPGAGGGTVFSVSRDGNTAVGYVMKGNEYAPAKWVDGKLSVIYPYDNGVAQCYTVSDDGQYAAGWGYTTIGEAPLNRTIALWTDSTVEYLSPRATYAEAGRRFSPDNSKLVCESMGQKFVYDLNTKEKTYLPFYAFSMSGDFIPYNQLVCYVNNDGLVLGGEEIQNPSTGQSDAVGYVYDGEKARDMTEWLKTEYNVEIDASLYKIYRGVEMSNDGKVIALLANVLDNGNYTGNYVSIIVALDREVDICPPVSLKAEKLRSLNSVRLTWKEPVSNGSNVIGYNIYRNNTLVEEGISEMAYIDQVPAEGEYTYAITALYEGNGDDIVESEKSESVTINVVDEPLNQARNIESHAVNFNNLKLRWSAPEPNLPSFSYFDYNENAVGFGGGLNSFSAAMRMPIDIVDNYAGSHVIARVAFMPRNAEAGYTIKVYVNDVEKVSQAIDKSILSYNNMNTLDLDAPVAFTHTDKVVIAIDVDASTLSASSNDIVGMCYGKATPGYSDLLRKIDEPEYYSLNQSSVDAGYGEMLVSWAISAVLAELDENGNPNVAGDVVKNYDLYRDETLLSTIEEPAYLDTNIATGRHTYAVVARYADESVSAPTYYPINFQPKTQVLSPISDVTITSATDYIMAQWNIPYDNDATIITYANGKNSGKGIKKEGATELVEYTVAHDYPYSYFDWYDGYYIEALRFYPTAEALFAIVLEVNGVDYEMIVLDEMNAPGGYILNEWNVVKLTTPYKIEPGNSFRVKLVCSEVDPSSYPITMDTGRGIDGVSDLYSFNYSNFSSAHVDGGLSGSWMLGMLIANDNTELLPVEGFNVLIDGVAANTTLLTEPVFEKDNLGWDAGDTHRIKVNVLYNINDNTYEVEGAPVIFTFSADVESIEIDRVKVYPNPATSYINVTGDVERVVLYDMSGRVVAEASSATLDVTALAAGNYLLNVISGATTRTVKVCIVR